jgi:hypothetical protein
LRQLTVERLAAQAADDDCDVMGHKFASFKWGAIRAEGYELSIIGKAARDGDRREQNAGRSFLSVDNPVAPEVIHSFTE